MKLNHVTIVVKDVEKSKEFYRELMGFECPFEEQISGEQFSKVTGFDNLELKFAVLKLPDTNVILELAQFLSPKQDINRDFRHITFEVEDVDEVYDRIKEKAEIVSEPVTINDKNPKMDGKRFFYFYDPDGNLIEILKKKESLYSSN